MKEENRNLPPEGCPAGRTARGRDNNGAVTRLTAATTTHAMKIMV
jgi:hypothetical protein